LIINHFTATGIVFNSKKEILMVHHKKLNVWLPPGGHVEENELPDDAVLREIYEETGIKAKIISNKRNLELSGYRCRELETPFLVLLEDINEDKTHNHIDMIYLCEALNEEFVQQETEIQGIGWFSAERIKELETYENVVKVVYKAVEYINDI